MKIIVGLGNPGPQYETTRHNVGFLAVDRLVDRWHANGPSTKHQGEIYQCRWENHPILLIKPQTYMNLSGACISPIFNFYHCQPDEMIVIHDDVDLPFGTLRLKTGGGTGGHNGLKSIDEKIGKENNKYHRIRIGIGRPEKSDQNYRISTSDFVLQPFHNHELKQLDSILENAAEASEEIFKGRIQQAMNRFHRNMT